MALNAPQVQALIRSWVPMAEDIDLQIEVIKDGYARIWCSAIPAIGIGTIEYLSSDAHSTKCKSDEDQEETELSLDSLNEEDEMKVSV